MTDRKFHHGNLRNALLELAAKELEEIGYEALSLRELAKKLDVSRAAPYRHFENKDALLFALAKQGMEMLTEYYFDVSKKESNPRNRLKKACRAYTNFAKDRPELYRLTFLSEPEWHTALNESLSSDAGFFAFEKIIAEALALKDPTQIRNCAVASWCVLHGFAMLQMKDFIGGFAETSSIEDIIINTASSALDKNLSDANG